MDDVKSGYITFTCDAERSPYSKLEDDIFVFATKEVASASCLLDCDVGDLFRFSSFESFLLFVCNLCVSFLFALHFLQTAGTISELHSIVCD